MLEFLKKLQTQDPDLYDQVFYGSLIPSQDVRHLVRKMAYILGPQAAEILKGFRYEQGDNLALIRRFTQAGSNVFLNPQVIISLIVYWQDINNLAPLVTAKGMADLPRLDLKRDIDQLAKAKFMIDLVIAEQTMLTGDALLVAIDKYWKFPKPNDSGSGVTDLISDHSKQTIEELAYLLIFKNPSLRENYFRYKLALAYSDQPYQGYAIKYQELTSLNDSLGVADHSGDTQWINERLIGSELSVVNSPLNKATSPGVPGYRDWRLQISPAPSRLALVKPTQEQFQKFSISLPSAEDFYSDRLVTSSFLPVLGDLKGALGREYFFNKHLPAGPENSAIADKMTAQEILAEVLSASK